MSLCEVGRLTKCLRLFFCFWFKRKERFSLKSLYFHYFLIVSFLRRMWTYMWTNFALCHVCLKFQEKKITKKTTSAITNSIFLKINSLECLDQARSNIYYCKFIKKNVQELVCFLFAVLLSPSYFFFLSFGLCFLSNYVFVIFVCIFFSSSVITLFYICYFIFLLFDLLYL